VRAPGTYLDFPVAWAHFVTKNPARRPRRCGQSLPSLQNDLPGRSAPAGGQVRNGLPPGERWIRTLGPP
jgi:hypothetical protein